VKRSVQIKITLSADMHARLGRLAVQLGQAPASVASMAVGEFVRTRDIQSSTAEAALERMVSAVAPMVQEQLKLDSVAADAVAGKVAAKRGRK
jgi:predicted transcriptional regulator